MLLVPVIVNIIQTPLPQPLPTDIYTFQTLAYLIVSIIKCDMQALSNPTSLPNEATLCVLSTNTQTILYKYGHSQTTLKEQSVVTH